MRVTTAPAKWFDSIHWQTVVLILTSVAMTAAFIAKFVAHSSSATVDKLLLVGILGSCLPILFELIGEMARGNFSVDLLAAISIVHRSHPA